MVIIASNNPKLVNRWSRALQKKYELSIVTQKNSLLRSIGQIKPRVLLLDASLSRLRVERDLPNIQNLSPSTRILVLFESPTINDGISVLKAGAKGYAVQNLSAANLEKCVASLIRNELWVKRSVLAGLFSQFHAENRQRTSPKTIEVLEGLSDRKRQIAELIAQGVGTREISAKLGIGEAAIKAQLTRIFRHFEVSNRLQLALKLTALTASK